MVVERLRKENEGFMQNPTLASMKLTIIYVFLGSLWILMSDRFLGLLDVGKETVTRISIVKGWMFVIITGILAYTVVRSILTRLRTAEDKLSDSWRSLSNTSRELEYQAYHDQITGARNKKALTKDVSELISSSACGKFAFIAIDIDNFKYINDTKGHSFGDRLLAKVCLRLGKLTAGDCNIYKLGEDGFVIVLEGFNEVLEVKEAAARLLQGFKAPFDICGSSFFITISLGIAVYPDHGHSVEALLKNADIALSSAKATGKNRMVFYSKPMDEAVLERVAVEKHLRTALEKDEFELYYQPQMDTATKKVSGFEALIRWNSPELGPVSPAKFISIAEDTHMIIPIGEWVLRNACLYLKKLHQRGYTGLSMAVNVSMIQLLQEDFTDKVMKILDGLKLNPRYLELEITESTLMESCEEIEEKLHILRDKGIEIALDDFGKGYSSLYYLRQLPISTLKIDKSFIDAIDSGEKHKTLANFMVRIGRTMGLKVVAEGVETKEQLDYLIKNKCHRIQGYFFSKPIPGKEAAAYLEEQFEQCK